MKPAGSFFLGVIVTIVVAGIAVAVAVMNGQVPANADGPPLPGERWAAQTALNATLRRAAAAAPSPPPVSDDALVAGVKLYGANCIVCHGTSDRTTTLLARGQYQRPPSFGRPRMFARDAPGAIYWEIDHGIRWTAMPSFGARLTDEQIWQLVLLLKNLDTLPPAAASAWTALKQPVGLATATPAPTPSPRSGS